MYFKLYSTPSTKARWIFMSALAIRILIANSFARRRWICKGVSQDGGWADFSQNLPPHSLLTTYQMKLLSSRSISFTVGIVPTRILRARHQHNQNRSSCFPLRGLHTVLPKIQWKNHQSLLNHFLFIKNKQLFKSSKGFSALEKTAMICSQKAMLPIQSGVTALCRWYWKFGALGLVFEFPGSAVIVLS